MLWCTGWAPVGIEDSRAMVWSALATAARASRPGGLGAEARAGEELGALREVLARLGRAGAAAGVGATQPQGGTAGEGVERDEHASSEEVLDANSPSVWVSMLTPSWRTGGSKSRRCFRRGARSRWRRRHRTPSSARSRGHGTRTTGTATSARRPRASSPMSSRRDWTTCLMSPRRRRGWTTSSSILQSSREEFSPYRQRG